MPPWIFSRSSMRIAMDRYREMSARLCRGIQHRVDDVIDFHFRHARIDRQRQARMKFPFGPWKIPGLIAISAPVVGLKVQGNEVNAARDAAAMQRLDEFAAIFIQTVQAKPQDVEMPGRAAILADCRDDQVLAGRK